MADAVVKLVQQRAVVTIGGGELTALRAAQAALPYAERAEAALAEIEEIASGAPDAPSILNKVNLNGGNIPDTALFRVAIGADLASNINVTAATDAVERSLQARARDSVSVLDYIPVSLHAAIWAGTSTTDVASYVQAALDENGSVYQPAGTKIRVSSFDVPGGKTYDGRGKGDNGSVIEASSATGLVIDLASTYSVMRGVLITSAVTRAADAYVRLSGNWSEIADFSMVSPFIGVEIADTVTTSPRVMRSTFQGIRPNGIGILNRANLDVLIDDIFVNGDNGGTKAAAAVKIERCGDVVMTKFNLLNCERALWLESADRGGATPDHISSVNLEGGYLDSCTYALDAEQKDDADLVRVEVINTWLGNTTSHAVRLRKSGTGKMSGFKFVNPSLFVIGGDGINFESDVDGVRVLGGASGQIVGTAIPIPNGASNVSVIDHESGAVEGLSLPNGNGITIGSGCYDIIVALNRVRGNTGIDISNASSTVASVLVVANLGGPNSVIVDSGVAGEDYRLSRRAADGYLVITPSQFGSNGLAVGLRSGAGSLSDALVVEDTGGTTLPFLPGISFTDDAAAAAGGVKVGGLYHTSGTVKVRTS